MAQTIKLKRSSTGGAVPSTSSLSLGEVAINTYDGKMYIKKNDGTDSIVQIGAGSGSAVWNSYDYTATSSQTSFSGNDNNSESLSYVPGFLQVFLNGILLDPAVDYAATTGSSIVLTVGATTSDLIQIETFTQIIGTGDILVDTFPVSSTQTAFTLSQDPINKSNISVYVEGVYQESSTYSLSTTTLTLSESPANGTTVEVVIGTRNVTLDNIADLTISGTLHAGALDLGDANIINVNEISLDTIKGDADANTNITFAGSDVTTFTQGGTERLRLNTTGAEVTGNIVVSGTVDGRDVAADGVTADAALSRAGGAMGGAITTNSTFDGRDVSVDGTKLDGIESGATADQTDVEIRAAVESASDSNVFTNADHSKLDAIEALADVTDATNVTAAGALMDSEVTNLAQVKAFDSSDYATAAQGTTANAALPKAGGTMTGKLTISNASYANHLELVRGSDTLYLTPSGGQLLTNGGLSPDVTNQDDLGRTDKYWQDLWLGTSLKMGGTTVIDASRNLTNIGTISSGAITSSGSVQVENTLILSGSGNNSINTTNASVRRGTSGEIFLDAPGHAIINIDTNNNNTDRIFGVRTNAGTSNLFSVNESGNATFAGTISSGAITTSGNVSVGGSAYTTATDLNLLGDGISIKNDKAGSNNNWSLIQNTDTGSASNLSFTTGLGVALTLNHNKSATFGGPITGTTATAAGGTNTTALASTAFVQQELTTLIGGAPSTLNDLNELAAAINDDANYNTTLTTALATKLPKAGGTMTGNLTIDKEDPNINLSDTSSSRTLAMFVDNNNSVVRASGPLLLQVGSQSALTIDASRNTVLAGTLGSGAITSSGKIIAPKLSIQNQINTTSSNLEINYENGDGTTTSFKDFYVRDGKNAVVLNIQGSSKSATFAGTISSGAITSTGSIKITTNGKLLEIADAAIQWYSAQTSDYKVALMRAASYNLKGAGNSSIMVVNNSGISVTGNTVSSGTLTLGAASNVATANAAADDFVIKGVGTAVGLTISQDSQSGTGSIFFGDPVSSAAGGIRYNHNTGDMAISAEDYVNFNVADGLQINGNTVIDASRNITVGTIYTTPVTYAGSQDDWALKIGASNNAAWDFAGIKLRVDSGGNPRMSLMGTGEVEAMAIVGSQVGIGTTTPTSALTIRKAIASAAYGQQASMIEFKSYFAGYDTETVKSAIYSGVSDQGTLNTEGGYMAFHVNNNGTMAEKLRIEKSGNVGIGTANPLNKFVVAHESHGVAIDYVGATLPYQAGLFTSSSALTQTAYGDLNIKSRSDYTTYGIGFFTANVANTPTLRMKISNTGKATFTSSVHATNFNFSTAPNYAGLSLGVYNSGTWLNTSANTTGFLGVGGNGMLSWHIGGVNLAGSVIINEAGADADFRVESDNNTHALFVNGENGRIGVSVSNPGAPLDVRTTHTSTTVANANTNSTLIVGNAGTGNNVYNAIKFAGNQQDMYMMSFNNSASASRRLGFFVGSVAGDAVSDEKLSILGNGRVGINEISPSYPLDVNGTASIRSELRLGSSSSDPGILSINDTSGTAYTLALKGTGTREYTFEGSSSGGAYNLYFNNANVAGGMHTHFYGAATFNQNGDDHDFRVESNNNTHMLFIDGGNNNLMIGNTVVNTASGFSNQAGFGYSATGQVQIAATSNLATLVLGQNQGTNGSILDFRKQGTQVGSIAVTGAGTTYNTTSDRRLKKDIQTITDGTDKLMAMNPVTHGWKAGPEADTVHGFIAQEMMEIIPEAVSGDPEGEEMMSMDYGRITPVIVAALQDALKEIKELNDRINKLENNNV